MLGLAGSVLGRGAGAARDCGRPVRLTSPTPAATASLLARGATTASPGVRPLQGIGIGVLVSLLFSVVPLLQVRSVKPSLLLRDETRGRRASTGPESRRHGAGLGRAGRAHRLAGVVAPGRADRLRRVRALAVVLMLAGRLLVHAVAPLAHASSFPLRHAVLHLSRPGNQTRVILLAVGLGAFFIVGVRALQASLLEEFSLADDRETPPTCS